MKSRILTTMLLATGVLWAGSSAAADKPVSQLVDEGLMEAKAYNQLATYEAGLLVARSEGFIPAPETNHALACVIDLAKQAKEEGKEKVILCNFSGHGIIDLGAYEQYLAGKSQ